MGHLARVRTRAKGSALIEFAIVLPLLVVFIVGIYDFSGAFNQKQKISHAAQEGANLAGAQAMTDMDPSSGAPPPDSLQPVLEVIFNSLSANHVLPPGSFADCTVAPPMHPPGTLNWQYSITGCSPDLLTITIDRGVLGDPGPPASIRTTVKVSYPYHWRFNRVIQILVPGAVYADTTDLNETASVHNQM
jgi:hypothetical protein